jgi:hypothetical protein
MSRSNETKRESEVSHRVSFNHGSVGRTQAVRIGNLFGIVIATLLMAGCDGTRNHADLHWTEPVTLASGEVVRIRRHVELWHYREFGGGFSSAPEYRTSSIELIGSGAPIWDAPMVPIVLDMDPVTHEWIVVASGDGCSVWTRNGRPRPPYWAFRLRDGKWYRDALLESFVGRSANLFVEFDVTDRSNDLDEKIKARKQSQAKRPRHAPQYGSIHVTFDMRCDRAASEPVGHDELDLKAFAREYRAVIE